MKSEPEETCAAWCFGLLIFYALGSYCFELSTLYSISKPSMWASRFTGNVLTLMLKKWCEPRAGTVAPPALTFCSKERNASKSTWMADKHLVNVWEQRITVATSCTTFRFVSAVLLFKFRTHGTELRSWSCEDWGLKNSQNLPLDTMSVLNNVISRNRFGASVLANI